jgi:rare lipoprotein A
MRKLLAAVFILILLPFAATEAEAPPIAPAKVTYSKPWFGTASWYGSHWNGKKTACGQLFDSTRLYAAHPNLPCGTWLRVTNVRTKHEVFVKVVDRGPYAEGREIDLAERAAERIGIKKWGTEYVKLEVVRVAK